MEQDHRINEFVCRKTSPVKDVKFHYTSPESLKSILDYSIFRFTDCQFLNDKSEYIHIEKPLLTAIEQLEGKIRDEVISIIRSKYNNDFNRQECIFHSEHDLRSYDIRYFVFCTSNNNDLLNMWNYYVKNGNYTGYNIGFSAEELLDNLIKIEGNYEFFHGNVVYTEEEQIEILKNYFIDISNFLTDRLKNVNSSEKELEMELIYDSTEQDILDHIQLFRLFFKDKAFIHEDEYRFIIKIPIEHTPTQESPNLYDFNIKNGIFAPFMDFKFNKDIIKNITVSPIVEYDLAKDGLERYLKLRGYDKVKEIKKSEVPIRC